MQKLDLRDCTFGINIRFTTEDRKRNIRLVIEHILKYLDTNIIVAEEDKESIFPEVSKTIKGWNEENCKYIFIESDEEFMGKTRAFNKIFYEVNTPIYVLQDADVICSPEMYLNAAQAIRQNVAQFCYSFDGNCWNVPEPIIPLFEENLDYNVLSHENTHRFSTVSPGGSIFINSEVYKECGMDNENMKAWGYDDDERVKRFVILGKVVARVKGTLYHLNHKRTKNSDPSPQTNRNMLEARRIAQMSTDQLKEEIKTWTWVK